MSDAVKACIFCKHCMVTPARHYESCTIDSEAKCDVGGFIHSFEHDSADDFLRSEDAYDAAAECGYYELRDEIKKHLAGKAK